MLAKAFLGLTFLLAVLGAALFGTAGTLDYWQAWAFLATFGAATLAITIDLAIRDRALLARRVAAGPTAERSRIQQVIQSIASLAFLAIFVIAGLDRRWGWSRVPRGVSIAGDVVVALGLGIVALVFRANTFTSATIEVATDQKVISTGPYAVVRHPMYAGAFLMLLGVPLALGSWWAAPAILPLYAVIVVRLLDEERVLVRELAGYDAYRAKVRYRLVPFVF
jgi:protein-S-isoprenylcysteine O-methyltransferase Ste14